MSTPRAPGSPVGRRARNVVLATLAALALGVPTGVATPVTAATPARPVVVWGGSSDQAAAAVSAAGGTMGARLSVVGGVAAVLDADQVAAVEARGLVVADDAPMKVAGADIAQVPMADHQLAAVNPGGDWDLEAGAGVGVALVDTGVTEVEDLRGRVVRGPDLSGEDNGRDSYGHGTFMAGLIAGNGQLSASSPTRHVGVAPGAHIVSVKVAGADGSTTLSKVLDGIGWVVVHADEHAIRVLNLSVAFPPLTPSYTNDPLSAAVEAAWATGITVVVAAGNESSVVTSPGRDPWAITVGALDPGATLSPGDDSVPAWSGREMTRYAPKPELLAPGVSVVSLAAPGSKVVADNPGSVVDGSYLLGSGTSMATAMTSGAVAVLTEHHAAATPDDYKAALVSAGRPVTGEIGRAIDLAGADLLPVGSPERWWQRFPVAFGGLGMGPGDRMPWSATGRRGNDAWVGSRWAGSKWAGSRWADHVWTGSRWAQEAFAGARWAGSRWAGSRWAGSQWAGSRWAGELWAGSRWAGSQWAGSQWAGSGGPARAGRAMLGPAASGRGLVGPAASGLDRAGPAASGRGLVGPAASGRGLVGPAASGQGRGGPTSCGLAPSGPAAGGPTTRGRAC